MDNNAIATLPAPRDACLFLDFDGTLVDIAATPDSIEIPHSLPDLLEALDAALGGRLALVSGRAVDSIAHHLPTFRGIVVGGHGAEMRTRRGEMKRLTDDGGDIDDLHSWAEEVAEAHPGARSELKATGAALHFRQAPHQEDNLRAAAEDYLSSHPALSLQDAHATVELRPTDATKACAVRNLLRTAPFAGFLPVFAGDDATDVPAMTVCQDAGGYAISLGGLYPQADVHLSSPADVRRLLSEWIR